MSNEIKVTFAGDPKGLVNAFDDVGDSALDMAKDLDKADDAGGRMSGGMSSLNEKVGGSAQKFMGTADLVDGLSTTMGINTGKVGEMAMGYAALASGFADALGPALSAAGALLGKLGVVTKLQTIAQAALNGVMAANPIFLVVVAVAALTAGFIIAYKQSETFRNIVNGAFSAVKNVIVGVYEWVKGHWPLLLAVLTGPFGLAVLAVAKNKDKILGFIKEIPDTAKRLFSGLAELLTAPFRAAVDGFKAVWNDTIGGKGIPSIGIGPFKTPGFQIPRLAVGGTAHGGMPHIVGERGPEMFVPGMTGTIIPNNALGGGGATFVLAPGGPESFKRWIREMVRTEHGGIVQDAFGT